ncbi:MAG: hypothetical protein GY761_11345 [Hyphomicrobiales bacterium]|nr:hypothetical protein [Hyphomicrobiales bacterium]
MSRKLFIATLVATAMGLGLAPAMANQINLQQFDFDNQTGGSQNGIDNLIGIFQTGINNAAAAN